MADSETQKLIHDAESALHKASEAVEDTLASTKTSLRKVDKKLTQEAGMLQNGLERVLGGKSLFWVEEPVDGRRLAGNMAGWGTFGVAVHAWHRGVQRMPVLGGPYRPYMLAFPIWSLLGYYIHHFELRQEEVIARRRLLLKRNRGLLEEKDYQEMSLSQGFKERHEKKSKFMGWLSSSEAPTIPKTFTTEGKEAMEHPVKSKIQGLVSKGHGEMEGYGKKLHEKLEAFEKEFAEQVGPMSLYFVINISNYEVLSRQDPSKSSAYAKADDHRKGASPYLSPSAPVPAASPGRTARSHPISPLAPPPAPESTTKKGEKETPKPRSGSGWGSLFGLAGKSKEKEGDIVSEVEKALR